MACTVDPYGNPYIPGSSIKGMLRTVLLYADILKRPEKYRMDVLKMKEDLYNSGQRRDKVLLRNIKEIESKGFHTLNRTEKKQDAVNDSLSGLIIGDSQPVSRKDIILCQKWEKHPDGKCKTLNVLRECMKPDTIIKTTMTLDKTRISLSPEDIMDSVRIFYDTYYNVFQKKFSGTDRATDNTVFLGGGSGFVSKSIIYALYEEQEAVRMVKDIFEKTKVPREHKHNMDPKLGVSPHILKCTRYRGKEYLMGQCELNIF